MLRMELLHPEKAKNSVNVKKYYLCRRDEDLFEAVRKQSSSLTKHMRHVHMNGRSMLANTKTVISRQLSNRFSKDLTDGALSGSVGL